LAEKNTKLINLFPKSKENDDYDFSENDGHQQNQVLTQYTLQRNL